MKQKIQFTISVLKNPIIKGVQADLYERLLLLVILAFGGELEFYFPMAEEKIEIIFNSEQQTQLVSAVKFYLVIYHLVKDLYLRQL